MKTEDRADKPVFPVHKSTETDEQRRARIVASMRPRKTRQELCALIMSAPDYAYSYGDDELNITIPYTFTRR